MSDLTAVLTAVAAWIGASFAWPVPRWLGAVVVIAAFVLRRPALLVVGVALLGAALASAAHAGLRPALPPRIDGMVELVSDPVPVTRGVRFDVRVGGKRFEATAYDAVAGSIGTHLAGERVRLAGSVDELSGDDGWLRQRHIVGRIDVERVNAWQKGAPAMRLANGIRRLLARGAESLPRDQRPLYTGLVFGDDRGQAPLTVDDFRAAGLGHLLAVSGQNVAFALAAARPLLERLTYRWRFPATVAVLVLFVLVTRAEPSVLRAAAMAGGAATAAALGRQASGLRVLSLAVSALVLVDPLLVGSLGFQLSVAASAGILVVTPRLVARLPGPRLVAEPLAVTLGAQIATAPLLAVAFGGLPVAAVPANVLAVPAAGPVMVWGLTGGVVAGVVGGPFATVLHVPTRGLVGWVELVGAAAGRAPLGELGPVHLVVLAVAAGVLLLARRAGRSVAVGVATLVLAVALVEPAIALRDPASNGDAVAVGVRLWQADGATVVVLDGRAASAATLAALRAKGVRRVDLVVARTGARSVGEVVGRLDDRYGVGDVWAPVRHQVRGARTPARGTAVRLGSLLVEVESVDPRLDVRIAPT